jgi:flagellin
MTISITSMSASRLLVNYTGNEDDIDPDGVEFDPNNPVDGVNIRFGGTARNAISTIENAINSVSMQRAQLGAFQNRLEFKIQNLNNQAENVSAAESRIRDADMAKTMTEFTKNNILFQASTAMLAQANSLPQSVLQLLG